MHFTPDSVDDGNFVNIINASLQHKWLTFLTLEFESYSSRKNDGVWSTSKLSIIASLPGSSPLLGTRLRSFGITGMVHTVFHSGTQPTDIVFLYRQKSIFYHIFGPMFYLNFLDTYCRMNNFLYWNSFGWSKGQCVNKGMFYLWKTTFWEKL